MITTKKSNISFTNYDSVLHSPKATTKRGVEFFKMPLPNRGQVIKKKVRAHETEIGMKMVCDSHSHMNGYAIILEHDYAVLTDKNGKFTITGIPAGKYRLVAWHEGYNLQKIDDDKRPIFDEPRTISKNIEISANKLANVDFEFSEKRIIAKK